MSVKAVLATQHEHDLMGGTGVFAKRRLYVGGPLETSHLHVLHGTPYLADSFQIIDGVYTGGMTAAAEKIIRGELSLADFR